MRRPIFFSIIITLLLGGLYVYQLRFTQTNSQPPPKRSIEDAVAESNESGDKSSVPSTAYGGNNLASFLQRIPVLSNFLQPTLFVDNTGGQIPSGSVPIKEFDESERELQTEIRNYLIASSDIGFSESAGGLRQALENAREGDPLPLIKIRDEFRQRQEKFRTLSHPQKTNNIHEQSVDLVERYTQLMDDTIHQTKGSVEETWNSEELKRIIDDAAVVKKEIIQLVTGYNIVLPPGIVL